MLPLIKAEFRKLLTLRNTYVFTGLSLLFLGIYAFWADGVKAHGPISDHEYLSNLAIGAPQVTGLLMAMVAILAVTQEYRFNTIMYTLSASNSRLKVLFAKVVCMSGYAIVVSAVFATLSPLLSLVGLHISGVTLPHQYIDVYSLVWRVLFYGWGLSMLGLIFGFILRNQIAAIVTFLMIPSTVETLIGIALLKNSRYYLPFTTLDQVLSHAYKTLPNGEASTTPIMSFAHAAVLFGLYMAVGWTVSIVLFLRRDAN